MPRIEDLDDPTFDSYIADELIVGDHEDSYPLIAAARAEAPVVGRAEPIVRH